ncbi:LamG-like jellyroll fold domain-containing protein, partial [uncultured Gimesia sp.]|uniref:LamG-like jellyroll fold domain-containing protein n=1 Tax=uncultured Gimesia sp. TaxID=1678688 RepID=UPI002632C0B6
MRFINWLNRHLGKTEPSHNLQFDSYREDGNAKLELIRLEDRIVLSVGAGVTGDVLELNLDAPNDAATVSVINSGATIQVEELGLPGSILQFDATQVSSILVTGTNPSQVINFLGQENLVLPGNIDLAGFTGDVNIGIQIQVDPGETPQFNPASAVTYLGQFQLTGDQLEVVLPNELNADDAFIIQINGPNIEILDPTNLTTPLFSAPTASINTINVLGTDGESDLLTLDYSTASLTDIAITFNGGSGGNDALEFVGGSFDTITHDLIGPTTGSVDFVDNGITEISYGGLEPVFGGDSTANNVVINLPASTLDAVLENSLVPGEMQIRSLSAAFEFTTFSMPADSLTINTTGGNSLVVFDSFDATFAPTNLILSGSPGDTYQLSGSDLLADSVSLTLSGGATLDLGSFNETIAGFTLEDGSVIATSGVLSLQSSLELRSGTVSADLSGTGLIINGTGTVVLNGTNTFSSSTAVQNGLLQVEGSLTTTQVVISAGATLGGSGTIDAPVTVNSGGHLVPGSSPGIINTGDLTLGAGAIFDIEIDGTQAGTEYDQIQVTGTVDVTGATLNLISAFTAAAGNEFLLIDNDGTMDAVTGTFVGLAEGTLFTFNGNQVFISYEGGDGNDVVLTVNSPPAASNQIFDVDENSIDTIPVGSIVATDTDVPPDSLTFSVTGGTGQFIFNVSPSGDITVADQSQLDFENTTSFDLDILVTDSAGATDTATITVNLNPLNDNDPVVMDQIRTIDENASNGTTVGAVIVATDDDLPGDTLTFSENGGTGAAAFDITAGGQIIVADQSLLDFETNPTYTLDIIVDDNAGSTDTATITINLNDLAETLFVNSADWSVNDITIERDGSLLRVVETGTANEIVPAHEFANVTDVVITGNASNNIVRLDYTGIITPSGGISFNGGVGSDTLISLNLVNNWIIDGVNSGSLQAGTVIFSDMENLTGDAGIDSFQFTGAGQITGAIDGLSGVDVIDYSASNAMLDLILASTGSTDGFAGSEASTTNSFDNINTIIGSGNTDSLTGINAFANWSVDGSNQYSSTNTLGFSGFENLTGGTNVDIFTITGSQIHNISGDSGNDIFRFQDGASLTGNIDGQSGADTLDYNLLTTSINAVLTTNGSFDGFQGTESSISAGFDNINRIEAGSGVADQLTGRDAAATWTIQPASIYGSFTSLGFSNFETLQGGSDVDIFNINGSHTLDLSGGGGADIFQFDNNGSSINGTIDGQDGDDHLNLTNYSENLSATLTGLGSIDGFAGNESAKSVTFENINQLTGGSGTNSLTGINSAADWTLNVTNSYQSTNSLEFSNFINLTGGTGSDIFNITPNSEALNIAGGDPTSNPLGDQLNVDTSAAGTALVSSDGVGAGTITGSFPTITYTEIENFAISGVVDVQVDGTTNNDVIEILVVGPNVEYRLGGTLIGSSSLADTNQITVNGGDGDDSLAVDVALAAEGITINYDGEGQDSPNPGDVLNLLGITTAVEYFFTNSSSGSVRIDGSMTDFITYTGLEPITSTITTADVTLNYSGVSETITITDAGGGQTTVNSTAGELLTFANPTNSLTINTGAGDDIIDINSLAANFTASLTINGEADNDTINANASISFDAGKLVEFNAETINVATGITVTAAGIAFNATEVNLDGDLVSTNVSGDTAIVNVLGSAGGADIQDAVDVAGNGGTINIAAGIYITADTLDIDESVSLLGAGSDVVEIRKADAPTNNFDVAVNVTADNVTISGAQLGWETHTSTTDYQGYVVLTTADNTTLNNLLFSDNYRSAVVFAGADNLEVSDSIFEGKFGRAAIRDGSGGSGENFLITRNEFRADHFRWGPIAIGPQGTFGDPNNFAFSGVISFNYFGNGLEAGSFQEAGDQNYTITITNGGMTNDGIDIIHNSFDWQDSATTNGNGIFAQPGGIFFDPALAVPVGTVNITDNIFNGFTYDGPQPTTDPLWNPAGGVYGGALEFDGVDDFGLFQDVKFDVGEAGTLSFWVNMDDQGKRNQFFEGPNNGGMEFQYRSNSGGQFFGSPSRNGNSNNYVIQNGGAGGTEGIWQNIQYTWDFNAVGNPQMHLFIDGTEIGYLNTTFDSDLTQWLSTVSTVNELMNVARDPGSGRFFDGLMDDVGWFNQALNTTDLATIRGAGGVANLSADARLVAHWDFDQSSGNIAIDNKNGIEMFISTNGIVPFGPEFQTTAGQFGGALQFDGIDDFATFQDASFDVGKKGTLNFWVQMDDTGRRNQFFEGPDNGGLEFQYRSNGGGQFYGRTQDGADFTIQQGGHSGVQGVWTNIQYTWDADTGQMRIYLDGVEQSYLSSFDENLAGFDSTHFTDT